MVKINLLIPQKTMNLGHRYARNAKHYYLSSLHVQVM
jgi:hypothetical protein